jgi:hypothetical protein
MAELGSLVGGVSALHEAIKFLRPFVWRVTPEPRRLDEPAALRRGYLLLAGEIMLADSGVNLGTRRRKGLPVSVSRDDPPPIARQFVGEVLAAPATLATDCRR